MCRTNNEGTVCQRSVELITKTPSSRITFKPGCHRAMIQHIVRHRLTRRECKWKEWDDLARRMYLVRPDGSPWSDYFTRTIHPLVVTAVIRRWDDLVKTDAFDATKQRWHGWTRGLLSRDWDGTTVHQDYALELLQGGDDDCHSSESSDITVVAIDSARAEHGTTSQPAVVVEEHDDDDDNDVVPRDSVTWIGRRRPSDGRQVKAASARFLENMLREEAHNVIELKLFVARKTYGPVRQDDNSGTSSIGGQAEAVVTARDCMRNLVDTLHTLELRVEDIWAGIIDREMERHGQEAGIGLGRKSSHFLAQGDPWRRGFLWNFLLDAEDQLENRDQ